MKYADRFAEIDLARSMSTAAAEVGDMETAGSFAGLADATEFYLNEDIDSEWSDLTEES